MSDFPAYDGSSPPDEFIRQCSRLATLGQIADDQLCVIVAAKCRGRALAVVNGIEDGGEKLTLSTLQEQLRAHFGGTDRSVEQAAQSLSSLVKGSLSAQDYGLQIKRLVRQACPEFFDGTGQVKKTCVPSYSAALYRHFLIGLTVEEKRLLSRLKATNFENCLAELTREEGLQSADMTNMVTARRVRWNSLDSPGHEPARGRWRVSPDRRGRWSSSAERPPPGDRRRAGSAERVRRPTEWDRRGRWSSPMPGRVSERGRSASPRYGRWRTPPTGSRSWTPPHPDSPSTTRPPAAGDSDTDSSDDESTRPRRTRDETRRDRMPGRRAGTRDAAPEAGDGGGGARGRRAGTVRCWSCGGMGHLKRQCPNEYAGRYIRWG